ncbi:hypothetical protein Tco_1172058 [Tanacetum coccineum]
MLKKTLTDKIIFNSTVSFKKNIKHRSIEGQDFRFMLLRWKLHEYSGVHSLFLDGTSIQINMLVDKKYPLKKEISKKMINLKIEAEKESDMASELIKFIKSQIAEQS